MDSFIETTASVISDAFAKGYETAIETMEALAKKGLTIQQIIDALKQIKP